MNQPGSSPGIYAFSAFSVLLSLYLMAGFVFCDKGVVSALQACTGSGGKAGAKKDGSATPGAQRAMGPGAPGGAGQAQRSALSYRRGAHHPPHATVGGVHDGGGGGVGVYNTSLSKKSVMSPINNLDAEVSLASTTSQSTYPQSAKFRHGGGVHGVYGGGVGPHHTNAGLDEPDQLKHRGGYSDSEDSDIDRRSLDLASSHTSDDEYENNHVFDPSDLKALSVNDFPQY